MGIRPCVLIARSRCSLKAQALPVIDDGGSPPASPERTAAAATAGALGAVPGVPASLLMAPRVLGGGDPGARA